MSKQQKKPTNTLDWEEGMYNPTLKACDVARDVEQASVSEKMT